MVKICLVTHFFHPHIGGIERVAVEQCKRLSNLGYQISVLTSKTHKQNECCLEGMKIFAYPVLSLAERVGLPYPIPSFKAYKIFAEVISKSDIVHVHGHPYISSCIASKVAKKYKRPLILTQHNTFVDFRSWLNIVEHLNDWFVGSIVLKNADKVITVSRKTMEYVLKLRADKSKISVIYNGVDQNFFHPMDKEESRGKLSLPENKIMILTVRRLVYKNGLDTLIESASILARDIPNLLFVVVGNGSDRRFITNRIKQLGVNGNFKLTGFVPEKLLPLYYNAADYFVLPSSSGEGLPMVLLEAMACGLPVIATKVGGIPEIIRDMMNGVLVPPRNKEALAQTILKLLSLKEESEAIRIRNRKIVEDKFNWDKNLRQLIKVYEEIL
jgi:glycosyltransferase involved in cell wall biosynthesis